MGQVDIRNHRHLIPRFAEMLLEAGLEANEENVRHVFAGCVRDGMTEHGALAAVDDLVAGAAPSVEAPHEGEEAFDRDLAADIAIFERKIGRDLLASERDLVEAAALDHWRRSDMAGPVDVHAAVDAYRARTGDDRKLLPYEDMSRGERAEHMARSYNERRGRDVETGIELDREFVDEDRMDRAAMLAVQAVHPDLEFYDVETESAGGD